jgi:acyl-coenzyme A thioesterase PaaI-like protein
MLSTLRKNIEKNLKDRGLSLRPTDLAALVEGVAPKSTRVALGYALDFLRPFSAGMGFRVTRLSDRHVELVVPARKRNQDEEGRIHEGALWTAALEAARLLWLRHAPPGGFTVH